MLADVEHHQREGRLAQAVAALADVLERAPSFDRKAAWEKHCLGSKNLLWRFAETAVAADECVALVERFLAPCVLRFVENSYRATAANLLRGQVRTIQALADDAGSSPSQQECVDEAAAAFAAAFTEMGVSSASAEAILPLVARAIQPQPNASGRRVQTWVLLAGETAQAVRFWIQLIPGETGRLLPDPLGIGLTDIGVTFIQTLRRSWDYATDRWPCPAGHQAVWGFEGLRGIARLRGDSAGAAMALAARAILAGDGVTLDPAAAISATLDEAGRLGPVEGGDEKLHNAANVGCDRIFFHLDTINAMSGRRANSAASESIAVASLDDAWERFTETERYVDNFRRQMLADWASHWTK